MANKRRWAAYFDKLAGSNANKRPPAAYLLPLPAKLDRFSHISVCEPPIRHRLYDSTNLSCPGRLIRVQFHPSPLHPTPSTLHPSARCSEITLVFGGLIDNSQYSR